MFLLPRRDVGLDRRVSDRGQILFRIDPEAAGEQLRQAEGAVTVAEAALAAARAAEAEVEARVVRTRALAAEGIVSQLELETQAAQLAAAASRSRQAEAELTVARAGAGEQASLSSRSFVRSPVDGVLFTDQQYHNIGIGMDQPTPDVGRFTVTKKPEDTGAFKTPTLRDIAKSAPYFHDGSAKTLEEAVDIMLAGGKPNQYLDKKIFSHKRSFPSSARIC